ncbi:MAG: MOSC domain-containing protein [Blastocatellia bacterium]|nr:MOSC domain-containing protein [Blastocatellia bacterium]
MKTIFLDSEADLPRPMFAPGKPETRNPNRPPGVIYLQVVTDFMNIGQIKALYRYPVKSMAGELLLTAHLGWHGLAGDRRFAFRRMGDKSGFPWLTAGKLPQLLMYQPSGADSTTLERLPTHVRTPNGRELELGSVELREEISALFGSDVEMMNLKHGIFDEAAVSVISLSTVDGVAREYGKNLDLRRFRPNLVIETNGAEPFSEDGWVGRTLTFGDVNSGPAIRVTLRDERCAMVNLDPDTVNRDAEVMKTIVRLNGNCAGVYGTVVRSGELQAGQIVSLVD